MYANEIWKRLTCFVLTFGTGVLIAESFFVEEIRSYPTEHVIVASEIELQPPVILDCKREYAVIPLAQRNLQSETLDQLGDRKKRKKDRIQTYENWSEEIEDLLRRSRTEGYGTPGTLLYTEHCSER